VKILKSFFFRFFEIETNIFSYFIYEKSKKYKHTFVDWQVLSDHFIGTQAIGFLGIDPLLVRLGLIKCSRINPNETCILMMEVGIFMIIRAHIYLKSVFQNQ
jgi:hypothetical protein